MSRKTGRARTPRRDGPGGIRVRAYGRSGPWVIVLHGGPGAAGHMAPVARALAERFRVLEPFQRGSGGPPLTVARHVADLHQLATSRCGTARPALVGSSWGAMLALAYAAEHPEAAGPLVLIGCGTFDPAARGRFRATLEQRIDPALRRRLDRLAGEAPDPDQRLRLLERLLFSLYSHDADRGGMESEVVDARAHRETWEDMVRLQDEGWYPAAFQAIRSPVLMLHGAADPHPGEMIRASLEPHLPQLEYREWPRCGHYPWLERGVRGEFFAVLGAWLDQQLAHRSRP